MHYSQINYILWSFAPNLPTDCGHFSRRKQFFRNFFKKFSKKHKILAFLSQKNRNGAHFCAPKACFLRNSLVKFKLKSCVEALILLLDTSALVFTKDYLSLVTLEHFGIYESSVSVLNKIYLNSLGESFL